MTFFLQKTSERARLMIMPAVIFVLHLLHTISAGGSTLVHLHEVLRRRLSKCLAAHLRTEIEAASFMLDGDGLLVDYRVVARRRGYEDARLEVVRELPATSHAEPPLPRSRHADAR